MTKAIQQNIMRQCIQKVATGPEYSKDLSFDEAYESMRAILAGDADKQPQMLANKWQDNAGQVALWCQQQAHERFMQRQQPDDYVRYKACVDAVKTLQHPGVNKSMVLFGLLKQFQR